MNDWLRSLTILVLGFVAVVVVTVGLANLIVPIASTHAGNERSQAGDGTDAPRLGGDLFMTGNREGTFNIHAPGTGMSVGVGIGDDERLSLTGDGLRIAFEAEPLQVAQLSYDGLEFFPEEGDCMFTPGESENDIGIGMVELRCEELRDVRGDGVIGLVGNVGLPVSFVVERAFPEAGGRVAVGDELWEFEDVPTFIFESNGGDTLQYSLHSVSGFDVRSFVIAYDFESGEAALVSVERDDSVTDLPEDACEVSRAELGEYAQILVTEVLIRCASIEVPRLGAVPIEGTVIVDETQFPDQLGP